jgi:predicted CoA-substrate-specific enzyme activase
MMLFAGIDIGAGRTKMVIADGDGNILAKGIKKTHANFEKLSRELFEEVVEGNWIKRDDIKYIVSTGLGRYSVPFRTIQVTELTAGAYGAKSLFPKTRCVLDIGAQSTRAIRVDNRGIVVQFKVNDKCAAGSGSFIVKAARYLEVPLEEVGRLSLYSQNPQPISSICAVLAESEIINHITEGKKVEDILRGIHDSLSDRALALLRAVGLEEEVTFIGGVAVQDGMVSSLQEKLGLKLNVPDEPEFVVALGAALLGKRRLDKLSSQKGGSNGGTQR